MLFLRCFQNYTLRCGCTVVLYNDEMTPSIMHQHSCWCPTFCTLLSVTAQRADDFRELSTMTPKISLLHCTCQFWAQFHIGSCNYFSTFTFIYMAAPLPTYLQFIWFCDVILHILTSLMQHLATQERTMTGKLGDLTAHSFFQTTNDFWTDCSFFDRIYPSTSPWKIMLPALPHVEKPWLCLTLWLLDPSIRFQSTKETPPQINVEEITVVGFLSGEAMMTLSQYILMFKTACSEIFLSEIGFYRNWSQTQWYAFSRIPCTAIFLNIKKKTEP